jgi:membrane-associated HD superfamily phosphohydrolase
MRGVGAFVISVVLLLILAANSLAIPQVMTIRGTLRDSSGNLLSGSYQFTFRIYNVSSGGTPLWTETQNVTVTSGSFTVPLGSVNPINLTFDEDYYLGLEIGSDGEMTPRQRLTSVSYTFRSNVSEGLYCTDCLGVEEIEDVYVLNTGDTISGNLNLSGNNLTDVNFINPEGSGLILGGDLNLNNNNIVNVGKINGEDVLTPNLTTNINANQHNISNISYLNPWGNELNFGGTVNVRNIIPFLNNLYTLGTPTHYFSNAYIGVLNILYPLVDSQISNDITANLSKSLGQINTSQIEDSAVTPEKVSFNYAGSTSKGGPASDLNCTNCVSDEEIENDITIETSKNLRVGGGFGSGGVTIYKHGDIWTNGSIFLTGNVTSADISNIEVNGTFTPVVDNEIDLGNDSYRWRDIYVGRNVVINGSVTCDNCVPDSAIPDTITAINYLLLTGGTLTGTLISQSIIPALTNSYNLGNTTNYFDNIYVRTINLVTQLIDSQISDDITANLSKSIGQVSDSQISDVSASKITGSLTDTQVSDDITANLSKSVGQISTTQIENNAVTDEKVRDDITINASGNINAEAIKSGTIDDSRLSANVFFVNGSRSMTGNLDVGGYNITNVDLVDGVNISNPGTGLTIVGNQYVVTLGTSISTDEIEDEAVTSAKIALSAVNESHLSSTVAGTGLSGGAGSPLSVNTASGITISGDNVILDPTTAGTGLNYSSGVLYVLTSDGLTTSGDYVIIAVEGVTTEKLANGSVTNIKIAANAVNESQITTSVAGSGLSGGGGSPLSVNAEGGLTLSGDSVIIATAGVTTEKIADENVTDVKIKNLSASKITGSLNDSQIDDDITANLSKSIGQVSDSQISDVAATKITGTIVDTQVTDDLTANLTKSIGQVSTSQIADLSITNDKISEVNWTKLQDYPTGCPAGQAVRVIGDTLTCVDINNVVNDLWVNESGDTMTGNLNMSNNNITNLANINPTDNTNLNIDSGTVYIDATNNRVGIGTTSPAAKLHVYGGASEGEILVSSDTNVGASLYLTEATGKSAGARLQFDGANNKFIIYTSGTATWTGNERLVIDRDTGNVGVGTTSPGAKLHVSGGDILLDNTEWLQFKDNAGTARGILNYDSNNQVVLTNPYGSPDAEIRIYDFGGPIVISNSYLGINDVSPDAMLDIVSETASDVGLRVEANDSQTADILQIASSGASGGDLLTVDSSGNVGIGTITPGTYGSGSAGDKILHVASYNGDAVILLESGSTNDYSGIGMYNAGGTANQRTAFMQVLNTDIFKLKSLQDDGTTNVDAIFVANLSNGNVGIGTTNPGEKLDILNGNFRVLAPDAGDNTSVNSPDIILRGKYDSNVSAGGIIQSTRDIILRNIVDWNSASGNYRLAFLNDAGTEFVTFEGDTQRVGIGTTSPQQKLHIVSSANPKIWLEDTTTPVRLELIATDDLGIVGTDTLHPLVLRVNNVEYLRIDTSGNVGIGPCKYRLSII